jgi:CDP-diglyceride synthetase
MEKNSVDKQHLNRWLTAAVALPVLAFIIGLGPGWLLLSLVVLVTAGGMLELLALLLPETQSWVRIAALTAGLLVPARDHRLECCHSCRNLRGPNRSFTALC